jgi:hypothetical protein
LYALCCYPADSCHLSNLRQVVQIEIEIEIGIEIDTDPDPDPDFRNLGVVAATLLQALSGFPKAAAWPPQSQGVVSEVTSCDLQKGR